MRLPLLLAFLAIGATAHAGPSELTVNRCLSGKIKAAGKAVGAHAACASKEASAGAADPACHAKASAKLAGAKGAFAKLEAKYAPGDDTPCLTFDDAAATDGAVTTHVGDVVADVGGAPGCDAAKIRCVGRYVAAVLGCGAKASAKYGTIDPDCTGKASAKLANGASGCLDRAAAAGGCSNAGSQAPELGAAADAFVDDTLCVLDPGNPGCQPPPIRFVDNGDGTVSDLETGLQWERKTGTTAGFTDCTFTACPDPHAATNAYEWCEDANSNGGCDHFVEFNPWPPDGKAFTEFLAALNAGSGFAGHTDWRLPSRLELEGILLAPFICGVHPCIDPIFGPTVSAPYWTASDYVSPGPSYHQAYTVDFNLGYADGRPKVDPHHVRAVRGP